METMVPSEKMKVDYSPWSRKSQEPNIIKKKRTGSDQQTVGSACSSVYCRHHWNRSKSPPNDALKNQIRSKNIKELKVGLETQKAILKEFSLKKDKLLSANLNLLDSIDNLEGAQYDKINKSIEKYENRKDGIGNLQDCFEKHKKALLMEIDDLKQRIDTKLSILVRENETVDAALDEINDELIHLKNYKNNEYELRTLDIMALEQKKKELCLNYEEEFNDLQNMIQSETNGLLRGDTAATHQIKESIAKEMLNALPRSIIDQAQQNKDMTEEIQYQKKLKVCLDDEIRILDEENARLIHLPSSHIRQTMFPHLYKQFEKCSPDEDIELDIPQPIQLPF